jgi:anti-anti-sigma factor
MGKPSVPCVVTKLDDGFNFKLISGIGTDLASIQQAIDRVVAAKPKRVLLDMAACEYIGSAGMGALVHFQSQIRAHGGSLKIVAIRKLVFISFKITRLDQLFGIAPEAIIGK